MFLLAVYELRRGEISRLLLSDFDWRLETFTVNTPNAEASSNILYSAKWVMPSWSTFRRLGRRLPAGICS